MRVELVAHSCVLITENGTRVLTDPLFSADPVRGAEMSAPPPFPPEAVADVDAVLVSHAHPDHVDPAFFAGLPDHTPVLAPLLIRWPEGMGGPDATRQLDAWETWDRAGLRVTCVPVRHVGTSCGYVVEMGGVTAYFAGDTWYGAHVAEIARRFALDVALLPLRRGRVAPVMGPKGFAKAVAQLRPRVVVPIHIGLVASTPARVAGDPRPRAERLLRSAAPDVEFVPLDPGQSVEVARFTA